jgi:hypothetical protein
MTVDLRARIGAYLDAQHVLTIATVSADGPAAAAVFYAADAALDLYFISDPQTRHCRNLEASPACAITIHASDAVWSSIQGLQIEATARRVSAAGRPDAERVYLARFPEIRALLTAPASGPGSAVAARFAASEFYRITPAWIRFIDNTRGFGHREELRLGGAHAQ